jgi:hypothetical protein
MNRFDVTRQGWEWPGRVAAIAVAAMISLHGCYEKGATPAAAGEISLLETVPGQTSLNQFRNRFKVVDVRETKGSGIVVARAGRGADLNLGPLELTGLAAVFVNDRLFELHGTIRAVDSARFSKFMTDRYGSPEEVNGLDRWATAQTFVVSRPEGGGAASGPSAVDQRFVLNFRSLAAEAIDRGYDGIGP